MSSERDRGPAFPHGATELSTGNMIWEQRGMSLRDWFAGQAMSSIARQYESRSECAEVAYMMADAMLKQREKGGTS